MCKLAIISFLLVFYHDSPEIVITFSIFVYVNILSLLICFKPYNNKLILFREIIAEAMLCNISVLQITLINENISQVK